MEWKELLSQQPNGVRDYETSLQERDECVVMCNELSDSKVRYNVMPSIRAPRTPFAEIAFSVSKNAIEQTAGKFNDYIEQAKAGERVLVPCELTDLPYLRNRASVAKAGLSVKVIDGQVYIYSNGEKQESVYQLISRKLKNYVGSFNVDITETSSMYVRSLVSRWNSDHGDCISVTIEGDSAVIYRKAKPVTIDLSPIVKAQKALKAGALNLEAYDECLAAMRQMEQEMKTVLNSEIIARHIFG